ncbi:MAG: hypothetical protein RQ751_11105 [Longimicrobiales bacterium]|nr:hypothetical protein [Longimicrobiales bacterium]
MRALFALAALLLLPGALTAQGRPDFPGRPLRVTGMQPLNFGSLLAGVPTTIPPTDALNAGRFEIRGPNRSEVMVEIILPGALSGPGGASVALAFGPASAGFGETGVQVVFDPAVPQLIALPNNGRGLIFLGGTAAPPAALPSGSYSAPVILTLSNLSN